ncbi:Uncharacterised protein [Chlamydia trachomatis]|nr:Uncharacterised protein [Chlamydia trachomatis]
MRPALEFDKMLESKLSVSLCALDAPLNFQPMSTLSASSPITVVSTGAVRSFTAAYSGRESVSLFFHEPKCLSIVAITSSGFMSPAMQMATLLGT